MILFTKPGCGKCDQLKAKVDLGALGVQEVVLTEDDSAVLAGEEPGAILGRPALNDQTPAIGQDSLFWPASLCAHGHRLWVGEFKLSNRIVRYGY